MPTLIPALFFAALASASPTPGAALPDNSTLLLKPGCPGAVAAVNATRNRILAALRRDPPPCEWCGAAEAPSRLSWAVRLADHAERGEPLVLTGRVLRADGRTPAAGVLLYLYQTNAAGVYPRRGDETGNGPRHGYLRGWLRTDAQGRYCVATIRPGHYPGRLDPAHIHATVQEGRGAEGYINDFVFEGDPRVTPTYRTQVRNRGGSGIVRLARGPDGIWRGERTIVLRDVGR
jgi:protocatechuate 3,4-dioxygenase beta subunit